MKFTDFNLTVVMLELFRIQNNLHRKIYRYEIKYSFKIAANHSEFTFSVETVSNF